MDDSSIFSYLHSILTRKMNTFKKLRQYDTVD